MMLTNADGYSSHVVSIDPVEELRQRHLHARRIELLHARLRLHQRARPAEHVQLDREFELRPRPPRSTARIRARQPQLLREPAQHQPSAATSARSSSAISRPRWASLSSRARAGLQPDVQRQRRVRRQLVGQQQRPRLHPDGHRRSEHFAALEHDRGAAAVRLRARPRAAPRNMSGKSIERNTCRTTGTTTSTFACRRRLPGPGAGSVIRSA